MALMQDDDWETPMRPRGMDTKASNVWLLVIVLGMAFALGMMFGSANFR